MGIVVQEEEGHYKNYVSNQGSSGEGVGDKCSTTFYIYSVFLLGPPLTTAAPNWMQEER